MKRFLPLFLALALLLTGCAAVSTTESASQTVSQVDSSSPASAQESGLESAPSSSSSPQTDAGEISLTDSNGTQITLHTRTPRVVAAYGSFAEAWLLAGGELAGATNDAITERGLELGEETVNLGRIQQPDVEQLIALDAQLSASEQIYITGLGQLSSELAQLEKGMLAGQAGAGRTASSSDADFGAVSGIGTDTGLAGNPGLSGGTGGAMDTQQLLAALMAKKTCLEQLSAASNRMASRMSSLLDATGDSARRTAQLLETMDWFIEDLTAMQDTLDQYYPDLQESLTDAGELVSRTSEALKNGTDTLNLVQDALKESSDEIDAAARDSILGSLELLDRSLGALDATSAMRSASRTMKDTADQEWDKLEEETRFLSIDPSAKKRSFTSEKNQEPDTLQIILRTEEISLDDTKELLDAETEKEEMSPLSRMWNVLVKIWNAIVEIFKER